jgi:superfamily I DNA/RNA helicase
MRDGRVIRQAGFDGEYGVIRLFSEDELRRGMAVGMLFQAPEEAETAEKRSAECPVLSTQHSDRTQASRQSHQGQESEANLPTPIATAGITPRPLTPGPSPEAGEGSCGSRHILDELDPEQRAAAEALDGPVLIVAGPGTGKTRTLTHRIAHLVADCGAPPERCLALTFSRRAAGEMSERLERLLPGQSQRVPVMTFHGLGLSVLWEHGERVGLPSGWRIASDTERIALAAQALSLSEPRATQLLRRMSYGKRANYAGGLSLRPDDDEAVVRYQQELRRRGWLDFDDLIALPLEVLRSAPDILDGYRSRYRWISVDEFQDIDAGQYEFVKLLAPAEGNLCAIGDPDQAIYGFRGADCRSFDRLREDYPGLRTIVLARNYRSTQTIIDAALQAVAPSSQVVDRRLSAGSSGPEKIDIHACASDRAEAELVVHTIERMLGGWSFFSLDSDRAGADEAEEFSFADFAILYRTEGQAELLVEALQRSGIPYQRRSHERLLDRRSVQSLVDAMAALGKDGPAGTPVLVLLDRAAQQAGDDGRPDESSLAALRVVAARRAADLAQFLSELALGIDADLWDPRADRVSLLTLHAAKGLEFPVVFIVGCEDGLLPLHWGEIDQAGEDEERRLLFVGMTRARQRLILTYARKRFWRGSVRPSTPSPFLAAIERALVAIEEHRSAKKPAAPDRQRTLFES